jgi:hypothetical protein
MHMPPVDKGMRCPCRFLKFFGARENLRFFFAGRFDPEGLTGFGKSAPPNLLKTFLLEMSIFFFSPGEIPFSDRGRPPFFVALSPAVE